MKKIIFIVITFLLTVSVQAQSNVEKRAKRITNEMTEVLSLSEEETAQILAFQTERLTAIENLKKETEGDEETFKVKSKEFQKSFNKKLASILGAEKLKTWQEHMKAKQKK